MHDGPIRFGSVFLSSVTGRESSASEVASKNYLECAESILEQGIKRWLSSYNDLSYDLVSTDNSNYNIRHANYQFKIRYARTVVLKFSYFFRVAKSWNSLL